MNKPIVVFGGSFNPPTNAHFGLAEQIINDYEVDTFLFMPVGDHYLKEGLLPASIRVDMLREACKENKAFKVSTIEVESSSQLPTIETLELLQKQYPNQPIWFVLGTDNLRDLPNWDRYQDILTHFHVLVLERGDDKTSDIFTEVEGLKGLDSNIIAMNEEVRTTCSSTIVRNRLREGKRVQYLIPEAVHDYIQKHHLYK
ncbi:nicotinate (nicotinamide) nucleotide adenylyltransferase [Bacillus sp. M6-12]|uniref:nicotinate (nicotinamide) nucleotide adenylyltransferase n=1 Tax=Bacillus sp. M6-12 TaxID=2054166 RepID=UPI000C756456|nr:nicotinate (nicotinamide) nucleotide adenylyltransferase [Bacillus sp. M6-12]PLS19532.1 nicotinate (nicotinamide) nucleotide adenylyltransferase [Bacillus sp. M6-12]